MSNKIDFECFMTFKALENEWAPGVIAGTEGYKPEIVEVDLINKTIKLKFTGTIVDGRNDSNE